MSIETLKEKAKIYSISQEYLDSKEKGRLEFVTKFPIDKISELSIDQYVLGTDKESFCYWLEFKKIEDKVVLFGVGGGNASKFGLYKSKDGSYQIGFGEKKKTLNGKELEDYFSSIKSAITLAIKYVSENRISEIKKMNIPFGNMILQKILSIYYPYKFITIGSSNVLIDLAKYINLQNIDLTSNNLIEINYECKKAIDAIPEFKNWSYEKIGTFVWNYFDGENKKGSRNDNINYYLVGSYWDERSPEDQSSRFIGNGIWENGYDDKFTDEVKSVPVGSKIAIKAVFTREKTKAVMAIKARGTVLENNNDGKTLIVEWEENFIPFEVDFSGGYWATIKEVTNKEHIDEIFNNTINRSNIFELVKEKFHFTIFKNYIDFLRRIIFELKIQFNDQRIVYSVRDNRLNFTVGQRYCFNIYGSESKGVYGVISKSKLSDKSEPYEGAPPQPYYSYFKDFNPNSSEWESIIESIKDELLRTTKSGYRKYNNNDFENYVFSIVAERKALYNSLRSKMENVGFVFESEQKAHLQNREEHELKFIHPQLINKLETNGYSVNAKKFYIKPLSDEPYCEVGFVTGKSSPLFSENIFSKANAIDSYDNNPAWTNRNGDAGIDNLLKSIFIYLNKTNSDMGFPLNTILYGPPGTGKTYNTILRSAEIIENRKIASYDEALKIFKDNLHNRIEFITFHQNYSYEDFIQGLRPETDNKSSLTFDKKDGIFKKIADKALENIKLSEKAPEELSNEALFDNALEKFKEIVEESDANYPINDTAYIMEIQDDAFRYTGEKWTNHTNGLRMKFSDLKEFYKSGVKSRKDIKYLNNISGLASQHATYYFLVYEKILKKLPNKIDAPLKVERKNYVIVIDEINRANISRVFGELITLIEPDKRSHGEIPLEVKLPSGDFFIVPSNLYIIGTMNTADKSIALLDVALRRRFEFEPMYPIYEIEGQEIYDVEILQKINEQIIKSKGYDFQIGHAYFMGENKDLVQRMNKKVIPLLLEYYMNDEKEVKGILQSSGLIIEEKSWPLRIVGKNG